MQNNNELILNGSKLAETRNVLLYSDTRYIKLHVLHILFYRVKYTYTSNYNGS